MSEFNPIATLVGDFIFCKADITYSNNMGVQSAIIANQRYRVSIKHIVDWAPHATEPNLTIITFIGGKSISVNIPCALFDSLIYQYENARQVIKFPKN